MDEEFWEETFEVVVIRGSWSVAREGGGLWPQFYILPPACIFDIYFRGKGMEIKN
jgi:hypothetical protein